MATDVIMPALGVAQQTGTLLKWLKSEGEQVTKGEPLMEVETDKATVEIEAAASGILAQVTAQIGDEVPVGQRIALILAPGETPPAPPGRSVPPDLQRGSTDKSVSDAMLSASEASQLEPEIVRPAPQNDSTTGRILASPAAKRLARERAIDLAILRGSGPEGAILANDVLRASHAFHGKGLPSATAELRPLSPMRRIIGERMSQSKLTTPHFYVSVEIDMTRVLRARGEYKERQAFVVPSVNDFILHACARALSATPALNASYTESGIQQHPEINLGMAVALDEGLVVPVIRQADRLAMEELAEQTRRLAERAQNKKLSPQDYEGGTFTVSNLGMLGVDHFIAIINPPQCAILAAGRVAPRVVTDGDGIEIRSTMTASLSADHRVVDGAIAARFLNHLKQSLEQGGIPPAQ
jgi:pyruvate dehydrogenase E2 component (dihydrolipoamide acetyltransferase)